MSFHENASLCLSFIFDVGMTTLAKVPESFRLQNFINPEGTATGPLQLAERIDEPIWIWLPCHPEKLDVCHTYMEVYVTHDPAGWGRSL